MDYLKLQSKTAIITGGGQGIGESIAESLYEFGVKVMICDVNNQNGKKVADRLKANGGDARFFHCDVTNINEVRQLVNETHRVYERIDILINNAGIGSNCTNTENISDEEWNRMMDVNLKGPFNLCREVIPYMKKQKYGKIINISSGGGVAGMALLAHYSTAKAGLIGFTKSMALELAKHFINVNCIAVPTTLTPATLAYDYDSNIEEELKNIPWGRIASTKDIADMVLFLASDSSEYVTGQVLAPNGGKR